MFYSLALAGLLLASTVVVAEESAAPVTQLQVPPGAEQLVARINQVMPGMHPDSISPSPIAGYFEVVFGPRVVYMSADGRYLLQANILDLEEDKNLTEASKAKAILASLESVGEQKMVVFGDPKAKHTISVFTDIDCGYCRKLHNEMAAYNKAGIRVRYLFFPRSGLNTSSYDKAVAVWCAEDRNAAMTKAKAGKDMPKADCANPVAEHMALGEMMGINGTPAMVLPSGELLPGYIPADKLSQYLDQQE